MVKPTTTSSSSSSPPPSSTSHPTTHKYTGVRKRKWGKWVSEIRLPSSRERIWLGSFDTPKRAARAFDAAQFCLRGPSANFNFPHSLPDIPGGRNLTRLEIRAAAKEFANNYNSEGEEEGAVAAAVERLAIADDNESGGSPSSPSNSFSAVSDGTTVQFDTNTNNTNTNDVGSFFHPLTTMGSGNYASDFGLFPGEFHDYCAPHSPYLNFGGERADDGDCSGAGGGDHWNNGSDQYQCSYLWNF